MYKNAYGNTALKVATGTRTTSWIRRIAEGGEPERQRLAEELKQSREEAARKQEEEQQVKMSQ